MSSEAMRWIPVIERLPQLRDEYLIYAPPQNGNEALVTAANWSPEYHKWDVHIEWQSLVTHWMGPLRDLSPEDLA